MALHDEYDIQVAAGTVSRRHALNLVAGSGISYSLTDDSANDRSDLTITAAGVAGSPVMSWNVLGGWVGSNGDPAATGGGALAASSAGVLYASAFIADTATSFSKLGFMLSAALGGSGSIFTITDASGNNLSTATNSDTQLALAGGYHEMSLSPSVTPSAGGIYYVVYLFPASVTTIPTFYGFSPNPAAFEIDGVIRFGTDGAGLSAIANPVTISSFSVSTRMPFFGVK